MVKLILADLWQSMGKNLGIVVASPISIICSVFLTVGCVHAYQKYEVHAKALAAVLIFIVVLLILAIIKQGHISSRLQSMIFPIFLLVFCVFYMFQFLLSSYETRNCLISDQSISEGQSVTVQETGEATGGSMNSSSAIAIVEVMCNPRSPSSNPQDAMQNEYIELFNYGDSDFDLSKTWIVASRETSGGQQLISWDERSAFTITDADVIYDTTVIPAGATAIIMAPSYLENGNSTYHGELAKNTIILTVAEPDTNLGQEGVGLVCYKEIETEQSVSFADAVILYEGSSERIDAVISSYGGEFQIRSSVDFIEVNETDGFPYILEEAGGVVRLCPRGDDYSLNWLPFTWENRSLGTILQSNSCIKSD